MLDRLHKFNRLNCTISMMTNVGTGVALLLAALDAQMVLSVRESTAGLRARNFHTPSIIHIRKFLIFTRDA